MSHFQRKKKKSSLGRLEGGGTEIREAFILQRLLRRTIHSSVEQQMHGSQETGCKLG